MRSLTFFPTVKNLSKFEFSERETVVLGNGLKYAPVRIPKLISNCYIVLMEVVS